MNNNLTTPRLRIGAVAKKLWSSGTPIALALLLQLCSSSSSSAQQTLSTRLPIEQRRIERFGNSGALDLSTAAIWGDTAALSGGLGGSEGLLMTICSSGFTRPFPGTEATSLASSCGPLQYNPKSGELWVGNSDGLWRYRHGNWTLFRNTASVSAVTSLALDGSTGVWVLTQERQLYHFDGALWHQQDAPLLKLVPEVSNKSLNLYSNNRNACWLTLFYRSNDYSDTYYYTQRLDGPSQKIYPLNTSSAAYYCAVDTTGTPWFMYFSYIDSVGVRHNGQRLASLVNDSLQTVLTPGIDYASILPKTILRLIGDASGIYLFTPMGLYRLDSDTVVKVAPQLFNTRNAFSRTTYTPVAWHFDTATKTVSLIEADQRFPTATFRKHPLEQDMSDTEWADSVTIRWEDAPGSTGYCMAVDNADTLWVGMRYGQGIAYAPASSPLTTTTRWNTLHFAATRDDGDRVTSLAVGVSPIKWAVCGDTLYSFVNASAYQTHPAPADYALSRRPNALAVTNNGIVWVSARSRTDTTRFNLASYDGTQWKHYRVGSPATLAAIQALSADSSGLWALVGKRSAARISLNGDAQIYDARISNDPAAHSELLSLIPLSTQLAVLSSASTIYRLNTAAATAEAQWKVLKILDGSTQNFPLTDEQNPLMLVGPDSDNILWIREKAHGFAPFQYLPPKAGAISDLLKPLASDYADPTEEGKRAIRDYAISANGTVWLLTEPVGATDPLEPTALHQRGPLPTQPYAPHASILSMQSGELVCTLLPNSQLSIELFALNGRLLHRQTLHNPGPTSLEQRLAYERPMHGQCLIARISSTSQTGETTQVVTSKISAGALR